MSAEGIAWAFGLDLDDHIAFRVAVHLGDNAGDGGLVLSRSQSHLAAAVRTSRSTVNAKLTELERHGLERWQTWREDGGKAGCVYVVPVAGGLVAWLERLSSSDSAEDKAMARTIAEMTGAPCPRTGHAHVLDPDTHGGEKLTLDLDLDLREEGGSPGRKGRRPRPRDLPWEALDETTKPSLPKRRAANVALQSIRAMSPELSEEELAEEIRRRAANWPAVFQDATLTATALASHWRILERPANRFSRRHGGLTGAEIRAMGDS